MTDLKKLEATNKELGLEELKGAAGGIGTEDRPRGSDGDANDLVLGMKKTISGTAGPGGTSYLKTNIGGSANPGGDDI